PPAGGARGAGPGRAAGAGRGAAAGAGGGGAGGGRRGPAGAARGGGGRRGPWGRWPWADGWGAGARSLRTHSDRSADGRARRGAAPRPGERRWRKQPQVRGRGAPFRSSLGRSEERRVGKERRDRWSPDL